jgi:hypothetical protein
LLAFLVAALFVVPVSAGTRDELLRFVPEDVGFCLTVQDLRGRYAEVMASPFAQQVRKTGLVKRLLASEEWQQLEKVERYLAKNLGLGWPEIRDDVLGDAFVFAYRPGPARKPDQEEGLFLVRARDARVLARLVSKLNELQQETGELKGVDEREYAGWKYYRRREAKTTNFYLLRGPILVFSGQESFLKQAIDREQKLAADAPPPLAKLLTALKLDQAFVSLAINPRAWDTSISESSTDPGAPAFVSCWKALQGIGMALHLDTDIRLSLSLAMRTSDLPASARRFLTSAGKPSELWAYCPEHALFATGGRIDWSAMYDFISGFMTKAARVDAEAELGRTIGAMIGKDVIKEILPAIGPDWGMFVTAPPADSKSWPPNVTFAMKIARGEESDPVDQAILSAAQTWAQLAILAHNKMHPKKTVTLRSTVVDRIRVRYLQGDGVFPVGFQPAFALKTGYLVVASSPAELGRFKGGGTISSEYVPLVRMSLKDWRTYLEQRREALATALSSKNGVTKNEALARIDDLRTTVTLFDRAELRQRAAAGFVSFTLVLKPAVSLRK